MYGDRLYAFRSSAAPKGFPYLTGREQEKMLLYRPVFWETEQISEPANLAEANLDKLRANIFVDLGFGAGFGEQRGGCSEGARLTVQDDHARPRYGGGAF